MNIHKKLLSIGFKKSPIVYCIYVPGKNFRDTKTDNRFYVDAHYKLITKSERVEVEKNKPSYSSFPEWTHSYVYTFNKNVKIYACLKREASMELYYADDKMKCESISHDKPVTNRKDLIWLLPKEIRRQLLIQTLFK